MPNFEQNLNSFPKSIGLFPSVLNKNLTKSLEKRGNKIILFPQIHTKELDLKDEEISLLKNLSSFDWLIFTDIYSVDYFINKLENLEIDLFELDSIRVCALGEAVADRLRFVQVHADIITNNFIDEDIFKLLKDYLIGLEEFENLKVLLVKEVKKEYSFNKKLRDVKADVNDLNIYSSFIKENTYKLKALVKGGAIDEFLFFQPEDVFAIKEIFNSEKLAKIFVDTDIFAIDEITYQTLREFKLNPKLIQQKRG